MAAPGEDVDAMRSLCRALPKAELHAHLNGSIRPGTLEELAKAKGVDGYEKIAAIMAEPTRSMASCFVIFDIIHAAVKTLDDVSRITREMIEDCAADNVRYLEIRTTPKAIPDLGLTREDYMTTVLTALIAAEKETGVTARVLVSVNRSKPMSDAESNIDLAIELAKKYPYVVGVDFSGNPTVGPFKSFRKLFQRARDAGLKVAVHTAEIVDDEDTAEILDFKPDRLGHMCSMSEYLFSGLLETSAEKRIPIETCPASNIVTLKLKHVEDHPCIGRWLDASYPIAISTDDSGVFGVTLSSEYETVAKAYGLKPKHVASLALQSFNYGFADKGTLAEISAGAKEAAGKLGAEFVDVEE